MKYIFQKLQMKKVPKITGWYLVINNAEDLMIFHLSYDVFQSVISKAITEDFNVKTWKDGLSKQKHYSSEFGCGIDAVSKIRGTSFADTLKDLLINYHDRQFELIKQGYSILFAPNGISYSVDRNNEIYTVLEIIVKDTPVFPECTDVHYSQFPGGEHWYASVGCIDIKDKDGNIKWNTITEAEKATEWFLHGENGINYER
jgi:hypothetical protein